MMIRIVYGCELMLLEGASCHVGYRSCFYRSIPFGKNDKSSTITLKFEEKEKVFDPKKVYKEFIKSY